MTHTQELYELLKQVTGHIYPNEIEVQWSILIVVYPYLTGLVAGAFILASLVKVFNVKESASQPIGCRCSRPWPSFSSRRFLCSCISGIRSAPTKCC